MKTIFLLYDPLPDPLQKKKTLNKKKMMTGVGALQGIKSRDNSSNKHPDISCNKGRGVLWWRVMTKDARMCLESVMLVWELKRILCRMKVI